jgi:hypothetical protein
LRIEAGKKSRVFVPVEQLESLIRSVKIPQRNKPHPAGHVLVPLGHFGDLLTSAKASVEELKAAQEKGKR